MNKVKTMGKIEIVPAILRSTLEKIYDDWNKVVSIATHIQIDITDGVFAGDGTFRQIREFKKLASSDKIELHMMVHTPAIFVDDIVDLNPARIVFHIESFEGAGSVKNVYEKLRSATQSELGLAINPDSPIEWLDEHMEIIDYVLFLGYNPGWANQPINPRVYTKISRFSGLHPGLSIAVDGHVSKETIPDYVKSGARILAANTSIFGSGNPSENIKQLQLIAETALAN
jgi:ribulose-phosphate 3-epimerase